MNAVAAIDRLRHGEAIQWPTQAKRLDFAESLDDDPNLVRLREEFVVPTKGQLKRKSLKDDATRSENDDASQSSIYFCGNSLGLQAKVVSDYLNAYLTTWGSIAVGGHFTQLENSPLGPFQEMAARCAEMSADIVGASPEEIVIMNTLTVNLHLMMAAFYKPTGKKHKIMCEWRPFPSDYVSSFRWSSIANKSNMLVVCNRIANRMARSRSQGFHAPRSAG